MSTTAGAGSPPLTDPVSVRSVLPSGLTKLLWELRDAYEESTGETVRVSKLLLDRTAFVEFLGVASRCSDERVGNVISRIRAVAPDLLPAGEAPVAKVAPPRPAPLPVSAGPGLSTPPPMPVTAAPLPAPAGPEAAPPADRPPSAAEVAAEHRALIERSKATDGELHPAAARGPSVPGAPSSGGLFERARSIAGFIAAVLLSLAAMRYLVSDSRPVATATPAPSAVAVPAAAPAVVPVAAKAPAAPAPAPPADPVAALFAGPATTAIRIHGSNTVGEKLSPSLVEAFLKSKGSTLVAARSGASPEEKEMRARIPGRQDVAAVEVFAHGSSTAFADLGQGTATIGQSSRRIKPEERDALLAVSGDLTLPSGEHVIALDGVAVIVHPSNGIGTLTLAQLAKLFAGEVQDWSELGGRPGPVRVIARDEKSGTWDTFKSLVLGPAKKELKPGATRLESSGDLVKAVAADPSAIGFVGLPYVRESVAAVALSSDEGGLALLPTPFTVSTEDYPLSRRLYLYTPTTKDDSWAREFVDFAISDAGQRVVAENGFVSQTPRSEKVRSEPFQPAAYRALAGEGERLSLNFRFESGRDGLDNKAVRDLERLVRWLAANPAREVVLVGFADTSGDAKRNTALSLQRARSVERELLSRGIRPAEVKGLGQALPVAANTTEDGRNRNRRVEVWVR